MTSSPTAPGHPRRFGCRGWLRIIERIFAIFGVSFLLLHVTLMTSVIVSPSMSPALQGHSWSDGDRVVTELVSYRFRQPRRWEVVTFRRADGAIVMKRVVGLRGEKLQLHKNGDLVINEAVIPRPESLSHVRYLPMSLVLDDRSVDCGPGYFVLGDDSTDSEDSRFEGPIPASWILGRAWFIFQPFTRMGWVN
jgi:signal peptidase I